MLGANRAIRWAKTHATLLCWTAITIAAAMPCIRSLTGALRRIAYEWAGPMTWDTPLYMAVARGILHGFTPYRDLFEDKPPGIFVLTAISLALTGDMRLGSAVQAFAILGILLLPSASVLYRSWSRPIPERIALGIVAFVFSALFAQFASDRGGSYQIESIGAFVCVIYACLFVWNDDQWEWKRIAAAALCCAVAVDLKEPFVLVIPAVALILCTSPRELVRTCLLPLSIAGIISVVALWLVGWLGPYISIDLFQVLPLYVGQESPWYRGLHPQVIIQNLRMFSGLFPASLTILIIAAGAAGLHSPSARERIWPALRILLSIYLVSVSVHASPHIFGHHFALVVPFATAFLLLVLVTLPRSISHTWTIAITGSLACASLWYRADIPRQNGLSLRANITELQRARSIAGTIDMVLDRCDIDRYVFVGFNRGIQPFGFTAHIPQGPAFSQNASYVSRRSPLRDPFIASVRDASLVILFRFGSQDMRAILSPVLGTSFMREPCRVYAYFLDRIFSRWVR